MQTRPTPDNASNAANHASPAVTSAVNDAADGAELDPKLVAKITEQVLDTLKTQGITIGGPAPAPAAPGLVSRPKSNSQSRSNAAPNPTPLHHPTPLSSRQALPRSPTSPASSQSQAHSQVPSRYTPPSPDRHDVSSGSSSPEPVRLERIKSTVTERGESRTRRDSRSSTSGPEDQVGSRRRMRPVRVPSAVEETSIEKAWRPLFDNGVPTARLGQFLRGLAAHIIEDYKPKGSIVVTPGKLADFFNATKLSVEMFPWCFVFGGGKVTNQSISRIFKELRCQFHLIQRSDQDLPNIPGLTPHGFETFMIILIQAYPDQEYQRLDKAARTMPISNADHPTERFPKELSRRLFPAAASTQHQQRLTAAVSSDPVIPLNHSNPLPPPPPGGPPANASSIKERERKPYSSSALTSAIEDDDLHIPSSIPIERERKPYIAKEGSGKIYEDTRPGPSLGRTESNARRPRADTNGQSQSSTHHSASRPIDMSGSNSTARLHRPSMNSPQPNVRYGTSPSSHPITSSYTRSEGAGINDIPMGFYASNMADDDLPPPRRTARRQNTDDERTSRSHQQSAPPASSSFDPLSSSSFSFGGPPPTDPWENIPGWQPQPRH